MSKYDLYYKKLGCDIDFPINDMDAWQIYPKHQWAYNRLELALFQGINCGPMPVLPNKEDYPVILKPIMNLYGMGLNCVKLYDQDDLEDNWYHNGFWSEFLEGDHLSWDFIILNGNVQFTVCFKGHPIKSDLGKFDHWEILLGNNDIEVPSVITKLINERFQDYTGCLNVETIGDKMIEAHLRMGDCFLIQDINFHQGIIENYKGKEYDWSQVKLEPIFFFPFWVDDQAPDEMFDIVEFVVDPILREMKDDGDLLDYEFDDSSLANPKGWKRLFWFATNDKENGLDTRNSIFELLKD